MLSRRVHITGASGAGVSTTGRALAGCLGVACFDTDDVFWMPTDPPYQTIRSIPDRVRLLNAMLNDDAGWVLAGSVGEWGDALIPRFDLVVFLYVPTPIRLARLSARERGRFGDRLDPGGVMHDEHRAFMTWAAGYDAPDSQTSRSMKGHLDWLTRLSCPVLRIDGEHATHEIVETIIPRLKL